MTVEPAQDRAVARWWPAPEAGDPPLDLDAAVARLGCRQFRRALIRRLRTARVAGLDSPLITQHPNQAADVVIALVNSLLQGKD